MLNLLAIFTLIVSTSATDIKEFRPSPFYWLEDYGYDPALPKTSISLLNANIKLRYRYGGLVHKVDIDGDSILFKAEPSQKEANIHPVCGTFAGIRIGKSPETFLGPSSFQLQITNTDKKPGLAKLVERKVMTLAFLFDSQYINKSVLVKIPIFKTPAALASNDRQTELKEIEETQDLIITAPDFLQDISRLTDNKDTLVNLNIKWLNERLNGRIYTTAEKRTKVYITNPLVLPEDFVNKLVNVVEKLTYR